MQVGVIWPKKLTAGHHYHLKLWTEYVIVLLVAESFQVRPQVAQIHHALLSGPQKHQRPHSNIQNNHDSTLCSAFGQKEKKWPKLL